MNNWIYNNNVINSTEDFPLGTHGFVYKITNTLTGEYYIGKKVLIFNQKKKLGKKELANLPILRGRKVMTKRVQKESDWQTYHGSCKPLLSELKLKGYDIFKREILYLTSDKRELTYLEAKVQFQYNVLEDPLSYNDNCLGKFFNQPCKIEKQNANKNN